MPESIAELAQVREVVQTLLDELGLDAYLFEVEPMKEKWEIKIECAVEEGWETFRLTARRDYLLRGVDESVIHEMLLDDWREALSACVVKGSTPSE